MTDSRDSLRVTFDSAAELYDAARPTYPGALFDDLFRLTGLQEGDRVLEIGCGTGKATRAVLERGVSVVCVELGPSLEAIYTADEYIALLGTFSGHIAMEEAKREKLYREIHARLARRDDPRVRRHWYAILHVARRAGSDRP
jgi:protein-L-isoaspartate O-methyltransferase